MGSARVPMRPVTPSAPDSLLVPQERIFTNLRYIGRGAAADIKWFHLELLVSVRNVVVSDLDLVLIADRRTEFESLQCGCELTCTRVTGMQEKVF